MARHGRTQQSTAHAMGVEGEDGYPGRKTAEERSSLREKFGLAGAWMGPERDA